MNLLHPEKEVVITAAKRTLAIVFVCFINPTFILLSLPFIIIRTSSILYPNIVF